jgi:hypothetical protein
MHRWLHWSYLTMMLLIITAHSSQSAVIFIYFFTQ